MGTRSNRPPPAQSTRDQSPAVGATAPSACHADLAEKKRLPLLLRRAWYGLNQAFRRRIAPHGCTPDQYTVLRTLSERGPDGLTQTELVGRMSSDPNTVAALLERMEAAAWIVRSVHARDHRAKCVRLTPRGRRKFLQLRRIALDLQNQVLSVLPPARRDPFFAQLSRVADACRQAADERL